MSGEGERQAAITGTVTITGTIDPRIKKVIAKISTTKFPLEMRL